ncbi:MAG TPA: NGG1p interacting factor NIF3 [Peptococcaceae bacterium]|nr:NGG1p interacting factor NIF3 [Clostridia bacterium]HOB81487.1 NGG1p interacting factor NIF3 [Peptococcaceae bacterium]HPZ71778.1 NGG1p interacting factor NIF3 [Peptococcaceae bacterium]HQD53575.1 NGG1p interacting factor NIF3 [Peptococcaceae bacterium]
MRLIEIYQRLINLGKENDPRPKEEVEKYLARAAKEYEKLQDEERGYFDQERLTNPYSDTRILHGEPDTEVKKILAGIDMEVPEILLADRLREKGESIDLVLAHHPEGKAMANLYQVMALQEDVLAQLGVPINVAEGILSSRISEVERGMMPLNHNRAVDAARLLNIPFMCVHTPADNMVNTFLTKLFDEKQPETVGDVVQVLLTLPEYQASKALNAGPKCFVGKESNRAGKIFVDMTGGTSGSEDAFAKLAIAGVGTIVGMHMGEKHRKEAEKHHINVLIGGHMASDSLGLNLLLDELEKEGMEIISCSGFHRVKR